MSLKESRSRDLPHPLNHRTTMRLRRLLKMAAILLLFLIVAVRAQSALDGFDPNANGTVRVVVVQPDGKILLGGDFTTLSPNGGAPVTRNHIARLNPDGTLDTGFNPNAGSFVRLILVQADGKILVGGDFAAIGGQTRNRIARLEATTGVADSFAPNGNNSVVSIAVQADGKILVGGYFASIGGQPRNYIARLDATTGLADSFNPNANNAVRRIALQADGKILVAGDFNGANSIGGQTRNHIARLDAATGLADSFDPNASDYVTSIVVLPDGKILVGGFFYINQFPPQNTIGGQPRNRIARLDPTSGLADSFNPDANGTILSIALQTDGKILIGGNFFGFDSIGGASRKNIARLDATTGLADSFDPSANNEIDSIAVQADGKVLAAGQFTTLAPNGGAPVTRNRIARLDGTVTPSTLRNISTRLRVLSGDNALIGGMIASGTVGKRVIIRAIGPSLTGFGVPGALENPMLELFQGSTLLFSNDDWNNSTQQFEIAASGLAPSNAAESAIIWTMTPGQNYTAVVRGINGTTGIGVVEAFDLDQAAASKLGNISTRGFVDVDDNVMIAGLIAGPSNGTNLKVLVRALGPTLSDFGVAGALTNPTLDLVNASGTVIRSNDNWKDDPQQRAAIEAAGLAPSHDEEAALVETVAPGAYTAVVRGNNGTTGVGLVEAYNIP